MIHPLRHDSVSGLESFDDLIPRGHLHAHASLLVHVEAVLGWQKGLTRRGHSIALTGNLHLPELRAELSFFSSAMGQTKEHRAATTIVPAGFSMTIPLQFLPAPRPDESDVWALTPAPERTPPWQEHYAGQLDGQPLTFDQHVPIDVTIDLVATPDDCQSGRGAQVDVAGELRFESSTHMRVLFRDPYESTAPPSDDSDEAILIVAGSRVPIPRKTLSSLSGENPWMSLRVLEQGGRVICEDPMLGQPMWRPR
jgi:hypothetical protein